MSETQHEPDRPDSQARTASTQAECDLVLKGGITSGIVYPSAITALATHYRFRSIGGASAGAIAAAAAAAAEFGRASDGFSRLATLPDELAQTDARGATRLFRLFEPQASTRALFDLLVAGLMPDARHAGRATARWLAAAIANFPFAALIAAAISIGVVALLLSGNLHATTIAVTIPLAIVAFLLILALWIVLVAVRRIGANGYGLCSGMGSENALTTWLHAKFQTLAGLAPDLVMECTGAPDVITSMMSHVATDSVVCLAGVGAPARREFDVGAFNRTMVLNNGTVFGTVNANRQHYAAAADALARADRAWLARLITRRVPLDQFAAAFARQKGDIKVVIEFAQAS
jgi:hypothetical protein